MTAESKNIQRK